MIKAVAILRYLAYGNPASSGQIARAMELTPSTCFNILNTMVGEGLLLFEPATKTYRIGLGLIELASTGLEKLGFVRRIHPELERLAQRWRVTTTLWLRISTDRVILIDRAESGSVVQIHMRIGQRLPIVLGALGRCLVAHAGFPEAELRSMYGALRSENKISFERFLDQVEEARQNGYAVDEGNFVRGVTTISSPVLDRDGKPILAISTVGLTAQFTPEQVRAVGADLREITTRINATIDGTALWGSRRRPGGDTHGLSIQP